MLEYSLDDAELLLTKNHNAALRSLEVVENDLGFLRDQTTTIEVSILFDVTTTSEAMERFVVREDCQARKLNKEDAMDRCKWRKMIKDVR